MIIPLKQPPKGSFFHRNKHMTYWSSKSVNWCWPGVIQFCLQSRVLSVPLSHALRTTQPLFAWNKQFVRMSHLCDNTTCWRLWCCCHSSSLHSLGTVVLSVACISYLGHTAHGKVASRWHTPASALHAKQSPRLLAINTKTEANNSLWLYGNYNFAKEKVTKILN